MAREGKSMERREERREVEWSEDPAAAAEAATDEQRNRERKEVQE